MNAGPRTEGGPWPKDARVLKRGARRSVVDLGPAAGEVVKVLHGSALRDRLRARGEARAAAALARSGVRTPRLIASGPGFGGVTLRYERVAGARPLDDALTAPGARRRDLVAPLAELLCGLARAGAALPDLHPGNVLLDGDGDAWAIDVRGARVGRSHAAWLRSVADLCGALRERHPGFVAAVARALTASVAPLDLAELSAQACAARARANLRRVRVWRRDSAATEVDAAGIVRVRAGVAETTEHGTDWTLARENCGSRTSGTGAWATLVRAHLHALPGALPRALGPGWVEFEAPGGAVPAETPPCEMLQRALGRRSLRARGTLLQTPEGRTWIGPRTELLFAPEARR